MQAAGDEGLPFQQANLGHKPKYVELIKFKVSMQTCGWLMNAKSHRCTCMHSLIADHEVAGHLNSSLRIAERYIMRDGNAYELKIVVPLIHALLATYLAPSSGMSRPSPTFLHDGRAF